MIRSLLFAVLMTLVAFTLPALAATLPGPLPAEVTRVRDGDTADVRIAVWIDMILEVAVRLRGIDTPEKRGDCPEERAAAARAKDWLAARIEGQTVLLVDIAHDKYAGRAVAGMRLADGTDLAAGLIAAGLARPYDGGTKAPWCAAPAP